MIRGFLFDLDGVFYVSNKILKGANETIDWLINNKIPYRFITNTTTMSREKITKKLVNLGLKIKKTDIISANYSGAIYLKQINPASCKLILREEAKEDYVEFNIQNKNQEVIVIGDIGRAWSFDLMNELFNDVLNGSTIVALHKGRYFQTDDGLTIDTGVFVAGLKYAAKTSAHVIGKPSQKFFELATDDFKISYDKIAMVGDDLYNDIEGANNIGLFSILVKTGKYRNDIFEKSSITPNLVINSIAELPIIFKDSIDK